MLRILAPLWVSWTGESMPIRLMGDMRPFAVRARRPAAITGFLVLEGYTRGGAGGIGFGYNRAMLSRLIFTCALAAAATARAAATDCDRVCLKSALDQYLNAVAKHDPSAAPLVAGFRQTENAVVVRLGTGMWKTLTGLGKLQRRYLDPVSGQAGYFGIVEEGSESAIATVRVKVEHRKITEAEWLIARKGDPGLKIGRASCRERG